VSYDDDYQIPEYSSEELIEIQRQQLYDLVGFVDANPIDSDIRTLFWDLMYNDELSYGERRDTYEYLSQRLMDDYGIDFEGVWDWEAFREWYDAVAG
jgi:hypothetical protein